MAVIYDGAPVPPFLSAVFLADRWGVGNALNEDYHTLRQMTTYLSIYQSLNRMRNATGRQIHDLSRSDRLMIRFLRDEGMI